MASDSTTTSSSSSISVKTIYLIRHAESDENRRIASLGRCFKSLGKFSLPSKTDIYASTELINVMAQIDSNVSPLGVQQIATMGNKLKEEDFLTKTGIQLVVHSPLLRAKETSEGMLGCRSDTNQKAESVQRVLELDLLMEKTPQEWTPMYFSTFLERIANFEKWLTEQPEEKIAIVGHSQYFKAMLGLKYKFGNCDVWEVDFDPSCKETTTKVDGEGETSDGQHDDVSPTTTANEEQEDKEKGLPPQWKNLKQLFACEVK